MAETEIKDYRGDPIMPKGIYIGTKSIVVTGSNTSNTGAVTFSPVLQETPTAVIPYVKTRTPSAGSAAKIVATRISTPADASGVTFTVDVYPAPGGSETETVVVEYLIIGKPKA